MTLHAQAKTLLRYQSIGMIGIVFIIVAGVFSYLLFTDNDSYRAKIEALNVEIRSTQKDHIQQEVKNVLKYVNFKNSLAESRLKQQAKSAVEQAHSIASSIYLQQRMHSDDAAIKKLIIAALRNLRFFNKRGYYFIVQTDSLALMLPPFLHLEGTRLLKNPVTSESMKNVSRSIDNEQKSGYSRYQWFHPSDKSKMTAKITYTKVFEPFDWLIGTGDYVSSFEDDLRTLALEHLSSLTSNSQVNITILDANAQVISYSQPSSDILNEEFQLNKSLSAEISAFAKSGGGFTNFSAPASPTNDGDNRLAYVETIKAYDWVLIADISPGKINTAINSQKDQIKRQFLSDFKTLIIVLLVTALITLLLIYIYTIWFKRLFTIYQNNLDEQQQEINVNSKQLQLAAQVFDSSNDAIVVTDSKQQIIAVNPACIKLTGFSREELIGENPKILCADNHDDNFFISLQNQLKQQGFWKGETINQRKDGSTYPAWLSVATSKDCEHKVLNYISIFSDVSERKHAEQRLTYLADFDPLTTLAKRHMLTKRVNEIISYSEQTHPQKFALILVGLDRFKSINDSLGHNIGDQVLKRIAKRLSANIRASDLISRFGGDEFLILVNHSKADSAAKRLATRLIRDLAVPLKIAQHNLVVTPSIGIATYPENGDNFEALLKNTDAALSHAKMQGRNNFQFFTIDMHQRASDKLTLESGLRLALSKNQFEVYYQAQFDLATNELKGCEALLRWNCPELDSPSPDKFIQIAEDTGLILPIGQWVLDHACQQAATWQAQGYEPVPVAVNVSSYQFNKNIVKSIKSSLEKANLDPKCLVVEITESALMQDPEFTKEALLQIRELGIEIALDDFGTGYSSLAYLKRFPIDKLKIDRAFIIGLPADQDDLAITRSIIDVASNLNMTTIAEGVETEQQQQLLSHLGCHQMQGYLKARPVNAQDFETQHLKTNNTIEYPSTL